MLSRCVCMLPPATALRKLVICSTRTCLDYWEACHQQTSWSLLVISTSKSAVLGRQKGTPTVRFLSHPMEHTAAIPSLRFVPTRSCFQPAQLFAIKSGIGSISVPLRLHNIGPKLTALLKVSSVQFLQPITLHQRALVLVLSQGSVYAKTKRDICKALEEKPRIQGCHWLPQVTGGVYQTKIFNPSGAHLWTQISGGLKWWLPALHMYGNIFLFGPSLWRNFSWIFPDGVCIASLCSLFWSFCRVLCGPVFLVPFFSETSAHGFKENVAIGYQSFARGNKNGFP